MIRDTGGCGLVGTIDVNQSSIGRPWPAPWVGNGIVEFSQIGAFPTPPRLRSHVTDDGHFRRWRSDVMSMCDCGTNVVC